MPGPDFKPPPPPLAGAKTYVYKVVGSLSIEIDVFFPEKDPSRSSVIVLLYIHGGAMMGGIRTEYPRPIFQDFLDHGFIVASMDYRLLPEVDFVNGLLTDIRDVESWLRKDLPREYGLTVDDIVVAGGSAGAHLALLTPKLWKRSPSAILSFYAPTNMHDLPYLPHEGFDSGPMPECTSEYLHETFDLDTPISNTPPPKPGEPFFTGRVILGAALIHGELMADFQVRGIQRSSDDKVWSLPEKGSATAKEIDEISPLQTASEIPYPPTYLIHGEADILFTTKHCIDFAQQLQNRGIPTKAVIVPGAGHAFDIPLSRGDELYETVLKPSVEWIIEFLKREKSK